MLKDVIYRPKPRPTAVYFCNIRRVQLGVVRKALRNMQLPPWALLGLSFIGQSVLEIVCDQSHVAQLTVKMKLLGAAEVKNFDMFGDNLKKTPGTESRARHRANIDKAQTRLVRLIATSSNEAAKAWYSVKVAHAESLLEHMNTESQEPGIVVQVPPNHGSGAKSTGTSDSSVEFKYSAKKSATSDTSMEEDNIDVDEEAIDIDSYIEETQEVSPPGPHISKKRLRSSDAGSDRPGDSDDDHASPQEMEVESQQAREAPPSQ